ncbi:MAG: rod shape-determining protein MreC [Armatimonadetes bacterium]|nr:rod shape-determining protein MreC [Armatimonadota bacterium]
MNDRRPRPWITLIGLAVLGMTLGALHNHHARQSKSDPVTGLVRAVMLPVQSGLSSTIDSTGNFFASIFQARGIIGEHESVVEENQRLKAQLAEAQALKEENDALKKLLNARDELKGRWAAVRTIASYSQAGVRTIVIDKGHNQGVQVGAPVVSGNGLLGVVEAADANSSRVRLLCSARTAVSAQVENVDRHSAGICEGQDEFTLLLNYLPPGAPVQVGDRVSTSGIGQKYPAGIPIGVIEKVWDDTRLSVRKALVKPFASFEDERLALVLIK